jgi:hypothetical protein
MEIGRGESVCVELCSAAVQCRQTSKEVVELSVEMTEAMGNIQTGQARNEGKTNGSTKPKGRMIRKTFYMASGFGPRSGCFGVIMYM